MALRQKLPPDRGRKKMKKSSGGEHTVIIIPIVLAIPAVHVPFVVVGVPVDGEDLYLAHSVSPPLELSQGWILSGAFKPTHARYRLFLFFVQRSGSTLGQAFTGPILAFPTSVTRRSSRSQSDLAGQCQRNKGSRVQGPKIQSRGRTHGTQHPKRSRETSRPRPIRRRRSASRRRGQTYLCRRGLSTPS